VREIRDLQGSTPIPFDHVVLSATGTARTTLLSKVAVGDSIGISQEIRHLEEDCATVNPLDWTKTYAAVGGSFVFLENGVIPTFDDPGRRSAIRGRPFATTRATFTTSSWTDGTLGERGDDDGRARAFSRDTLGLSGVSTRTAGLLDDGGERVVKNNPSDGSERAVANGMMMVVVEPVEQSTTFAPNDAVVTVGSTSVRLGPARTMRLPPRLPETPRA